MKCPHCKVECNALVLETRKQEDSIIRRRACGHCGKSFYSREVADLSIKLQLVRHDLIAKRAAQGKIEPGLKKINRDAFTAWR